MRSRLKLFQKRCRFASKFHSVLSQEFFKSVSNYVEVNEVHFRHELRRKSKKTDARERPVRGQPVNFSSKIFALNSYEVAQKRIKLYKYTCLLL
jgi:hypothetical protein